MSPAQKVKSSFWGNVRKRIYERVQWTISRLGLVRDIEQSYGIMRIAIATIGSGKEMNIGLRNRIRNVFIRMKNDAQALLSKVSEWKTAQDKERKPVNVWVAAFLLIISILVFFLVLPMFTGIISIVFEEADPDTIPQVSQEALTGLIVVSAALGAFVLWFAGHSETNESDKRMIKFIGKLFLCAALTFSLFMLISPMLPDIRSSTDLYSNFLKYVTAISFIGGSISFAVADMFGLLYIWKF